MAYKRKPYRIKRSVKLVFWSFIALVLFTVANIFMNRPANGNITKPSLSDEPIAQDTTGNNVITTKYFNLTYDGKLDTVSNITSDDDSALEVYRIARSDVEGRRIFVVTIKNLPEGGVSEESSYKLRSINPDEYSETTKNVGDNSYIIMKKLDNTEITAFSVNNDKMAMLAYTIDAPQADIDDEADKLLYAFSWNL